MGSWQAFHEFELRTAEDLPYVLTCSLIIYLNKSHKGSIVLRLGMTYGIGLEHGKTTTTSQSFSKVENELPPSNLMVTFLEFSSIIMLNTKDESNINTCKLCFIILTCITEEVLGPVDLREHEEKARYTLDRPVISYEMHVYHQMHHRPPSRHR
ncbi:UPF0668 protein C10orf76 [Trichonephila clavipes]|nr:UPF0668 protein C10orf76 [Trichonephila clavipes]